MAVYFILGFELVLCRSKNSLGERLIGSPRLELRSHSSDVETIELM